MVPGSKMSALYSRVFTNPVAVSVVNNVKSYFDVPLWSSRGVSVNRGSCNG